MRERGVDRVEFRRGLEGEIGGRGREEGEEVRGGFPCCTIPWTFQHGTETSDERGERERTSPVRPSSPENVE